MVQAVDTILKTVRVVDTSLLRGTLVVKYPTGFTSSVRAADAILRLVRAVDASCWEALWS